MLLWLFCMKQKFLNGWKEFSEHLHIRHGHTRRVGMFIDQIWLTQLLRRGGQSGFAEDGNPTVPASARPRRSGLPGLLRCVTDGTIHHL